MQRENEVWINPTQQYTILATMGVKMAAATVSPLC